MTRAKFLFYIGFCSCLAAALSVRPGAAWPQSPAAVTNAASPFALEIVGPQGCPQYFPLFLGKSISLGFEEFLRPLPNSDASIRKPSALRLELETGADTVSIAATVLYGGFDHQKASTSVEDIPHELIATHSGKLNDEVAFPEMESVGIEPLAFRIVTAQPDPSYRPALRSNAPSIQIDYATADRNLGILTLHNLSEKAVVAYQVGSSSDGASGWSVKTMPRIAPGAIGQVDISDNVGTIANGTCTEDPKAAAIYLEAALFDDGSYEGDMRIAARLAAGRLGHDLQRQRIRGVTQPLAATPGIDLDATIERMRAAIDQLSVEPDADAISRLSAQFPGLPESDIAGLASEVKNQMKQETESMDEALDRYQTDASIRKTPSSFAQWWSLNVND